MYENNMTHIVNNILQTTTTIIIILNVELASINT